MNEFREANDYTFMTEQQMARSLLATFYGEVAVQIEDDQLIIEPDMSKAPDNIKEYENTLGIRLELGEDYKDKQVATSSLFYNEVKDRHYIGLDEKQAVYFDQDKDMTEQIHVLRSNGPLDIKTESSKMEVDLKTKGMQEFELYSPIELEITGNEDVEVTKEGSTYMVRHYGDETTVEIKAVK